MTLLATSTPPDRHCCNDRDSHGRRTRWMLWLLVFATCLSAVATASAKDDDDDDFDEDRYRRKEIRIPVNPDVRVDIELISGSIEIRGWDKPEVRIRTDDDNVDGLDVRSDADWVTVRATGVGIGWLRLPIRTGDVDLRIDLPKGSYITAKTINGPIEARDVEGRISFKAANGEIVVRGAPSEAILETMNSGIKFRGKGSRVDARTVNGTIDLRGVSGEVVANAISGSIHVQGDVLERADLRSLTGSVELETALAPGARISCKSYSGSISLTVPEDTSAKFDIQTFSGRIRNDLGPRSVSHWRGGPGQRLDFEAGDGDGHVTIDTFSGSVRIRTRD